MSKSISQPDEIKVLINALKSLEENFTKEIAEERAKLLIENYLDLEIRRHKHHLIPDGLGYTPAIKTIICATLNANLLAIQELPSACDFGNIFSKILSEYMETYTLNTPKEAKQESEQENESEISAPIDNSAQEQLFQALILDTPDLNEIKKLSASYDVTKFHYMGTTALTTLLSPTYLFNAARLFEVYVEEFMKKNSSLQDKASLYNRFYNQFRRTETSIDNKDDKADSLPHMSDIKKFYDFLEKNPLIHLEFLNLIHLSKDEMSNFLTAHLNKLIADPKGREKLTDLIFKTQVYMKTIYQNIKQIIDFLIGKGCNISTMDFKGDSPLLQVVGDGDTELTTYLITKNAQVNHPSMARQFHTLVTGSNPLLLTIAKEILTMLLHAGLDPDRQFQYKGDIYSFRSFLATKISNPAFNRDKAALIELNLQLERHAVDSRKVRRLMCLKFSRDSKDNPLVEPKLVSMLFKYASHSVKPTQKTTTNSPQKNDKSSTPPPEL